jgi:glycosyltransferase involved in cell wall biosynthesis
MTTHIVIPIGVSVEGTPVPRLLEKSIDSILNQSSQDFILTVAADTNISEEAKAILESRGVRVKWHDPHSFFAPGGIWKKISDCWKEVDSKYVAFLHYDDFWDVDKLKLQVEAMEAEGLNGSWSEVHVVDDNDNLISGDCASWGEFTRGTLGSKTMAFAHSVIVNREEFLNSGILQFETMWSPIFEDIFAIYLHKIGKMHKVYGAKLYWRSHGMSMSSTLCLWTQPNSIWKEAVESQMSATGYLNDNVISDEQFVMQQIRNEMHEIAAKY